MRSLENCEDHENPGAEDGDDLKGRKLSLKTCWKGSCHVEDESSVFAQRCVCIPTSPPPGADSYFFFLFNFLFLHSFLLLVLHLFFCILFWLLL
ncbi:hypothetical protein KC19_VG077100 [Ceratodon purpureus]|uniref:Uncharacterized protein n=1 Tax=Ceratodon purpureus TaxID=3225 RepID=A0A8T0HN16_CERPU|nr:hypothetical protein KC19_VG077100 [Ceratodon purpureus]